MLKIADIKGSIKKHQTQTNVGKKSLSQPNKYKCGANWKNKEDYKWR